MVIKKSCTITVLNAITHVDMVYVSKDYLCDYFERLVIIVFHMGHLPHYAQDDKNAKICIILL